MEQEPGSGAPGGIEIVWRDPPPKVAMQSLWLQRLAPLADRPGEWAMIKQDTPARISGLRGRLAKTVALKDKFEFRAHRVSDSSAELYARAVVPLS